MPEAFPSALDPPERIAKVIAVPQEKIEREKAEEAKNEVEKACAGVSEVNAVDREKVSREKRESSILQQASDREK